jgi:hypothetical protein
VAISFKQNVGAYFSNFLGLGLIQIDYGRRITTPGAYDGLKAKYNLQFGEELAHAMSLDKELYLFTYQHGTLTVSEFGHLFLKACLKKLQDT